MSIPYLNVGDSITVNHWNALWSAFDAKFGSAMNGLPIFYWNYNGGSSRPWQSITGQRFFFLSGTHPVCNFLFPGDSAVINYNHAPFVAVQNQADTSKWYNHAFPQYNRDDVQKVLVLKKLPMATYTGAGYSSGIYGITSFLDLSLAVMKQTADVSGTLGYSLAESASTGYVGAGDLALLGDPQVALSYHVAEIILEGVTTLTFAKEWDKYRFLRISNFNNAPATVNFQGTDGSTVHSVTVAAFHSATVRRENVDTGYEDGYAYFWKLHTGDWRVWQDDSRPGNNVINPWMVMFIIQTMTTAADNMGGKAVLDVTQFWDASSVYCGVGKPYGALADTTLIGDLIVHKGNLIRASSTDGVQWNRQAIPFNGFASIVADWTAAGLTIAESGSGDSRILKVNGGSHDDLVSQSTNVLLLCGSNQPAQSITSALTLPQVNNGMSYPLMSYPSIPQQDAAVSVTLGAFSYNDYPIVRTPALGGVIPTHRATVEDITDGHYFYGSFTGVSFTSKVMRMTGFGPIYSWINNVNWVGDYGSGARINYLNGSSISGVTLLTPLYWQVGVGIGNGWQNLASGPLHISPRTETYIAPYRRASLRPIYLGDYRHNTLYPVFPDWLYQSEVVSPVVDDTVASVQNLTKLTGCKIQRLYSANSIWSIIAGYCSKLRLSFSDPYHVPRLYDFSAELDTIPGGDTTSNKWWGVNRAWVLAGSTQAEIAGDGTPAAFHRLPLLEDHFNNLASLINGLVKVRPVHFLNSCALFPDLPGTGMVTGIFGTNIRPRTQYCKLSSPTGADAVLATSLGIPLKTISDLPGTYATLIADKNRYVRYEVNISVTANYNWVTEGAGPITAMPSGATPSYTGVYGGFTSRTWTLYFYASAGGADYGYIRIGVPFAHWVSGSTVTIYPEYIDSATDVINIGTLTGTLYYPKNLQLVLAKTITSQGFVTYDGDAIPSGATFAASSEATINTAAGGKLLNANWKSKLFGNGAVANDTVYPWVLTADVATAAAALGLNLKFFRAVVPLHLQIEDATCGLLFGSAITLNADTLYECGWEQPSDYPGGGLNNPLSNAGAIIAGLSGSAYPTQHAWTGLYPSRFVGFVPKSDGEWINEVADWKLRDDHAPANGLVQWVGPETGGFYGYGEFGISSIADTTGSAGIYFKIAYSDVLTARNWANAVGGAYCTVPQDPGKPCACFLIQGGQSGIAMQVGTGFFTWPSRYSEANYTNANAVLTSGVPAVPATAATNPPGTSSSGSFTGVESIITALYSDGSMVTLFVDDMMGV